jgi:predicted XRE-type DNA-binding protein
LKDFYTGGYRVNNRGQYSHYENNNTVLAIAESTPKLGFHVVTLLKNRALKQKDSAVLLNISQSDVSHLMNGHFSRFTTDKLLDFLKRLEQKVTIEIAPHHAGEPYQRVAFGTPQ